MADRGLGLRGTLGLCAGILGCSVGLLACGETDRNQASDGSGGSLTSGGGLGGSGGTSSGGTSSGGVSSGETGSGGDVNTTTTGEGGGGAGGAPEPSWELQAELPEPEALEGDFASNDVALYADTAALSGVGGELGNVRIFVREGDSWREQQAIVTDELDIRFGASVALFEDTLLVGAPDDGGGSVFLFERTGDTWSEVARLRPDEEVEEGDFGLDVALSGSTAMVATEWGAAYVFSRTVTGRWTEEQRLEPGPENESAKVSVAVDGETALVGLSGRAEYADGAAYVFLREASGWKLQQELGPEETGEEGQFGSAVALSGDTALVGSPEDRDLTGVVHVFSRDGAGWSRSAVLTGARFDYRFGHDVSIHEDVVVAATKQHDGYYSEGCVHVFERAGSSWHSLEELTSPRNYNSFGDSVSVFGDTALVAAPGDNEAMDWFGSAYVFTRGTGERERGEE